MRFALRLPFAGDGPRETPLYYQPPTGGTAPNGLPILSWDQAGPQIARDGVSWASALGQPATVTYAFRSSVTSAETALWPTGATGFQVFNATQIAVTEEMLRLWSEVANITFVRVGTGTSGAAAFSNNAQILFGNFTSGPAAFSAFTFFPPSIGQPAVQVDGNVWVNVSRNYDANPSAFPLGAHILAHEIGHAIGLNHPGVYNGGANGGATYTNDADFWQDTAMFSNMSYFSATFTGGNYGTGYALAPQMLDIAAAQYLYGANMTTRTGDTVYGFNGNAGHAAFTITGAMQTAIFCIWDCGGVDTLNLSGYDSNEQIDLRPESFSSAGPDGQGANATYNISIARGVTIENAIGGAGNDAIIGNDVANALSGGGGNDALTGGLGFDTANYASASTGDSWHRNADGGWTIVAGSEGTDTLNSIEIAHFSDRNLYLDPAQQTFAGDGTSDILWRRTDGFFATWSMNGIVHNGSTNLGSVGADWAAVGTGDFNGDGKDDIFWLRNDGLTAIWEMSGLSSTLATGVPGGVGTTWHVAGIGDFNTDGKDDLLWKNDNGLYAIWDMNGFAALSQSVIGSVGAEWSVQAVADFDGNGSDEILWRRNDGLVFEWSTNGASQTGAAFVGAVGNEWSITGTGDFNGDGRADILWQRDDGLMAIWEMNGATQLASSVIGGVGTTWHVAGVGDYNGDGLDDIFWRNDSGLLAVWTMNGFSIAASGVTGSVGDEWTTI